MKLHKNDFNSTDHVRGIWRARVTDTTWKRSLSGFFAAILLSIATQTFAAQSRNEGWDSVTAANATIPETFRGPSIYRGDIGAVQSLAFNPMDNPQSGNFHINIPLVQVPGRGNSLSINLSYNSQLWTSSVSQGETSMNFDLDGDWPSPGWSISFGKIVVTGVAQFGLLIEGNGMRHKAEFVNEQAHPTDASVKRYWSRTIDGSFILYAYDFKTSTGQLVGGYAKYRDGRESWFGAKNAKGNTIYLVKSRDVHGNYRGPLVFRAIYDGRRA